MVRVFLVVGLEWETVVTFSYCHQEYYTQCGSSWPSANIPVEEHLVLKFVVYFWNGVGEN